MFLVNYTAEFDNVEEEWYCCSSCSRNSSEDFSTARGLLAMLGMEIPSACSRVEEYISSKIKEEKDDDSEEISEEISGAEESSSSETDSNFDFEISLAE